MKYHESPFTLKELKIELTYSCPLSCIHCSSDSTPEVDLFIEDVKCLQIISEASELGVKEVAFSGGEPLLHSSINQFVQFAYQKGLEVILYTCGNIPEFEEKIIELKNKGLNETILSLYSSQENEHEQITRKKGSFKNTLEALNILNKNEIISELHFVALSRNYKRLREVVNLGYDYGVRQVSVLRFVPQGRGFLLNNDVLNKIQNFELKEIIESLRGEGYKVRTGSPFNFLLLNDNPACFSAINRLIIAPDLSIYPCDAFKQIRPEELIGTNSMSVLDKNNLKECWQKSLYLKAVRDYLTSDFAKPCNDCPYLEVCLSGCLAQKVLQNGNLTKSQDPSCMRGYLDTKNTRS